jgi:hypothetical protein
MRIASSGRDEWRIVCRRVEVIQEVEVSLTGQCRQKALDCALPFARQACLEFSGSQGQEAGQHVDVANLAQRRTDPFEVVSDVTSPDRVEQRLQGLQIGTKTPYGHPGLVDIIWGHVGSGEAQPPVMIEQLLESIEDGDFEDVSE